MPALFPLQQLDAGRFETVAILKKLASSSRALAELKRVSQNLLHDLDRRGVGARHARDIAAMGRSYTRKSPYARGRKAFCDTLLSRTSTCRAEARPTGNLSG